jgi:hypothetical protein
MTAPTGRKVFFLTDPIEDRVHDWSDYKRNYQATFTAKLLYPMVADYEVMPWPERIYTPVPGIGHSNEKTLIPKVLFNPDADHGECAERYACFRAIRYRALTALVC